MLISIYDDFDLEKIANSGQCFRVAQLPGEVYRFILREKVLYIHKKDRFRFEVNCSEADWNEVWYRYFDLSRNYQKISTLIPITDKFMTDAVIYGSGIRILHQDPWEMLISFIISQRKSISAIQTSIELLSEKFGTQISTPNECLHLFPTPDQLSSASDEELSECKLGYRVPYVRDAIAAVTSSRINLQNLYDIDTVHVIDTLKTIKGVGNKVANCISLFSYGRTECVPIDTWIQRIFDEFYSGSNPFIRYGNVSGILQQYAFYFAINNMSSRKGDTHV